MAYDRAMTIPILNILVGVGLVLGGASGKLALFGTDSTTAIMAVGGVISAVGIFQLVRALKADKY